MIVESPLGGVPIPEEPLAAVVLRHACRLGSKPALLDGPSGRQLTYADLDEGVRRVAAGLAERGLRRGDVLGIYLPNCPEYALAFLGAATLGVVSTTANPLLTAAELGVQLRDAGARMLVTTRPLLEKAHGAGADAILLLGDSFDALLESAAEPPEVAIRPRLDLAALPYSSGTSGLPKGVMLTHRNLVANLCQIEPLIDMPADAVVIGVLPFFHIYGQTVVMNGALHRGCTLVTLPRFDLEQFLQTIEGRRVTHAFLVPPIVLALARHPAVAEYDLSSLRYILCGAAPLGKALQEECAERLGCLLVQGYGLTEASPVTHLNPVAANRPGTVGVPVPGTECRLVEGEVWVRGPQVMKGYLNDQAASARTIVEDGWLRTGDLGEMDTDGYFTVVDRLKEVIKYRAYQVPPAELEAVLVSHPAVADAAVVPAPDEEAGEVPVAYVVLRANATPEVIAAYVAERVAPYKKVRRVEVVDEIPKSPSGKILRRLLVERERARAEA